MKFLINTTEVHRVDTEGEAIALIEEAKKDGHFILSKYSSEHKERKQKGEIVEEFYKVTLVKSFTDIKDPTVQTDISYKTEEAFDYGN